MYLSLLELAMKLYPFTLHTYCLMTNHLHLQIQTNNSPPSMIMKYMNSNYAKYFNKKYHHFGHVFDKQYDGELVYSSEYKLELSKYIHLNPLKADMVERLEGYKWSSYLVYVHNAQSTLVPTKQILSYFPKAAIQLYEKYLKSGYIDLSFTDDGMLFFEHEEEEK